MDDGRDNSIAAVGLFATPIAGALCSWPDIVYCCEWFVTAAYSTQYLDDRNGR